MSLNAEFVAVAPEVLVGLVENDTEVVSLFLAGATGARRRLSLEKSWHGVHYLLTGDPGSTSGVVLGGTEIGEDLGYGPARYFTAPEVAQLSAELYGPDLIDEAARYDPARMTDLSIYSFGWDSEARGWLLDSLEELRRFFRDAAASGEAIVTCLL